jgi:MFS family permease
MGTMVLPFLALYLTQELQESPGKAGLVLTFYGLGALISAPFAGRLSDKIGSLNLIKLSLLSSGAFLFIYSFIHNYIIISILSMILAVLSESFRPASMAFISQETARELRKPAYALYRLAINLGMSIGPVIGGLLSTINFSLLFYVDGFTSILAGIFLLTVKWNLTGSHNGDKQEKEVITNNKMPLKDGKFLFFLIAMLPAVMVFFQHMSSMPLFVVNDLGFLKSTFGLLVAVNTVLIIMIEVPLNALLSRWADWKALSLGALLCGIGFGGMVFTTEIIGLIITIIIWTFGEMIFFPSAAAFSAEISPENRRGEYMGYFQMMFSLAFTTAPMIGTLVLENYGAKVLWSGTFILGIFSATMMLILKSIKSHKNE